MSTDLDSPDYRWIVVSGFALAIAVGALSGIVQEAAVPATGRAAWMTIEVRVSGILAGVTSVLLWGYFAGPDILKAVAEHTDTE